MPAVVPTLSTSPAHTSGDSLSTAVLQFDGLPPRGRIESLTVIDRDLQSQPGELWLFNEAVTPAAANAAHSISDADASKAVGVIPFGTYFASALNSVAFSKDIQLPYRTQTGTLYGVAVTRGTPTYTAAGLTLILTAAEDR